MKTLKFTKMHGLGNDFMVVNGIGQDFDPLTAPLAEWSDRFRGVGFDQLLLVEKPSSDAVDFRYRIFNADGARWSSVAMARAVLPDLWRIKV